MENTYAKAIKEPENFIFIRDQGAAWDIFTIGLFRDLKHYAESSDVPAKNGRPRPRLRALRRQVKLGRICGGLSANRCRFVYLPSIVPNGTTLR